MRTRDLKAAAEAHLENFDAFMEEKFDEEFRDFMGQFYTHGGLHANITYDDIQGFMDSFETPDENEWAMEKVQSELDDVGDQQMEQERERDWNE